MQDYAREIYFALFSLQHRGQESAGMAVAYGNNKISYYKNMGLVSEVFGEEELSMMPPTKLGIGHVRYSTTGSSNVVNAQPVVFTENSEEWLSLITETSSTPTKSSRK